MSLFSRLQILITAGLIPGMEREGLNESLRLLARRTDKEIRAQLAPQALSLKELEQFKQAALALRKITGHDPSRMVPVFFRHLVSRTKAGHDATDIRYLETLIQGALERADLYQALDFLEILTAVYEDSLETLSGLGRNAWVDEIKGEMVEKITTILGQITTQADLVFEGKVIDGTIYARAAAYQKELEQLLQENTVLAPLIRQIKFASIAENNGHTARSRTILDEVDKKLTALEKSQGQSGRKNVPASFIWLLKNQVRRHFQHLSAQSMFWESIGPVGDIYVSAINNPIDKGNRYLAEGRARLTLARLALEGGDLDEAENWARGSKIALHAAEANLREAAKTYAGDRRVYEKTVADVERLITESHRYDGLIWPEAIRQTAVEWRKKRKLSFQDSPRSEWAQRDFDLGTREVDLTGLDQEPVFNRRFAARMENFRLFERWGHTEEAVSELIDASALIDYRISHLLFEGEGSRARTEIAEPLSLLARAVKKIKKQVEQSPPEAMARVSFEHILICLDDLKELRTAAECLISFDQKWAHIQNLYREGRLQQAVKKSMELFDAMNNFIGENEGMDYVIPLSFRAVQCLRLVMQIYPPTLNTDEKSQNFGGWALDCLKEARNNRYEYLFDTLQTLQKTWNQLFFTWISRLGSIKKSSNSLFVRELDRITFLVPLQESFIEARPLLALAAQKESEGDPSDDLYTQSAGLLLETARQLKDQGEYKISLAVYDLARAILGTAGNILINRFWDLVGHDKSEDWFMHESHIPLKTAADNERFILALFRLGQKIKEAESAWEDLKARERTRLAAWAPLSSQAPHSQDGMEPDSPVLFSNKVPMGTIQPPPLQGRPAHNTSLFPIKPGEEIPSDSVFATPQWTGAFRAHPARAKEQDALITQAFRWEELFLQIDTEGRMELRIIQEKPFFAWVGTIGPFLIHHNWARNSLWIMAGGQKEKGIQLDSLSSEKAETHLVKILAVLKASKRATATDRVIFSFAQTHEGHPSFRAFISGSPQKRERSAWQTLTTHYPILPLALPAEIAPKTPGTGGKEPSGAILVEPATVDLEEALPEDNPITTAGKTPPHHTAWRFGKSAPPFSLRAPRAVGRSFISI